MCVGGGRGCWGEYNWVVDIDRMIIHDDNPKRVGKGAGQGYMAEGWAGNSEQ